MIKTTIGVMGLLSALALPSAHAEGNHDYSVLIISRERLEVATSCEIGIYLNDQLVARLFQEQSTSFNLPAGQVDVRLRRLPGQAPGCSNGLENQRSVRLTLPAGQIVKYRIAMEGPGFTLRPTSLGY